MNKLEQKIVSGLTLLGILASYAGDHSQIEKVILIGSPFFAWLCLRSFIRTIRM